MKDTILDEFEHEPRKGIPSGAMQYFCRYLLCLYWAFGVVQIGYYISTQVEYAKFSTPIFIIIILRLVLPLYLIYYNLIHAFMEQTQKSSIPEFPKWMTSITIAILALNFLGALRQSMSDLSYGILDLSTSTYILNLFCLGVVLLQEYKYFKWGS